MQSNFRMVMRSGPTVGKVYPLDKNELFIGRDLSNDLVINDPEISRRHARLFLQGNGYILEDLGSTNGTFVNGQRLVGPNVLRPGDVITFGERMSLVYESSDFDPDATLANPASRPSYNAPGQAQVYPPVTPVIPPAVPPPSAQTPQPQVYNQPYASPPAYVPQEPAAYQPQAYPPPAAGQPPARPVDSYAGQIPSAYAPEEPAPKNKNLIWIILAIVIVLACICVAAGLWFAPASFWCSLPVDWKALGGTCP